MKHSTRTASISVQTPTAVFPLQIFDNPLSVDIARTILEGKTYPPINVAADIATIVDIGANVGAASLYFALQYPAASIYAFEPAPETYRLLHQNMAALARVRTFEFGLFDRDCTVPLYLGVEDAVTNSVGSSYLNSNEFVEIKLRSVRQILREQNIERIDILKVDTEGCELPILNALADMLDRIKVIYLEFHDEADRIAIDQLLQGTHILVAAHLRHPHRGELCYVAQRCYPPFHLDRLRIRSVSVAAAPTVPPQPVRIERSLPTAAGVQGQYQAAVIMPTVLRPSLLRAVASVFQQQLAGPAQLLIGIDRTVGDPAILDQIQALKPAHWAISIFDPGYSTSVRHGGIHAAKDGGALRTILSYAANSRHVAYLDDDNWWAPDHLSSLLAAISGHDWAYSKRWFVDADSNRPLCEDSWESVGPDSGIFRDRFGGFVDPNTLMIDKLACESVLRWWTIPLSGDAKGMSADRHIFHHLRAEFRGAATGRATCYYVMDPHDGLHPLRLEKIGQETLRGQHGFSVPGPMP